MDTSKAVQKHTKSGEVSASADVARRMAIARNLASEERDMDTGLPEWARRSNPIIRRQLGIHWRVFLPQVRPIIKWMLPQIAVILLTLQFEGLIAALMLLSLSTVFMLPFGFYLYLRALQDITNDSVVAMTQEFQDDSFDLLRITPFSLIEIMLAKMSGAVWRRMDDLDTVLSIALFTTLPVLTFLYVVAWAPDVYPGYSQLLIITGMVASLVRLPLEMFMVSALGIMNGTLIRWRSPAVTATLVLTFFYFVLLNMPRLLELSLGWQIVVDIVLPLVMPVVIATTAILIAVRFIEKRD